MLDVADTSDILPAYCAGAAAHSAVPLSAWKPPGLLLTGIAIFDWPLHKTTSPKLTTVVAVALELVCPGMPSSTLAVRVAFQWIGCGGRSAIHLPVASAVAVASRRSCAPQLLCHFY